MIPPPFGNIAYDGPGARLVKEMSGPEPLRHLRRDATLGAERLPDPPAVERAVKPRQPLVHWESHFWLQGGSDYGA